MDPPDRIMDRLFQRPGGGGLGTQLPHRWGLVIHTNSPVVSVEAIESRCSEACVLRARMGTRWHLSTTGLHRSACVFLLWWTEWVPFLQQVKINIWYAPHESEVSSSLLWTFTTAISSWVLFLCRWRDGRENWGTSTVFEFLLCPPLCFQHPLFTDPVDNMNLSGASGKEPTASAGDWRLVWSWL